MILSLIYRCFKSSISDVLPENTQNPLELLMSPGAGRGQPPRHLAWQEEQPHSCRPSALLSADMEKNVERFFLTGTEGLGKPPKTALSY